MAREIINRFDAGKLPALYDQLAGMDADLHQIITDYGYPPVWIRPNSFETLVLTILEQQVSLASAYAAYKKLKEKMTITPQNLLLLSDEELRACYLSRQKIIYTRGLASAIVNKQTNLDELEHLPDDVVRQELKKLKGIGDWTVDIYLIHALQRPDILPLGDLALINAFRMVKNLPDAKKDEISDLARAWKPYRSLATMLLWHYYIKKKNIRILH